MQAKKYFEYGARECNYLCKKDKKLGEAIGIIGKINREVNCDIFSSIVHHIVGQQISTAAQATIWARLNEKLGLVDAANVLSISDDELQSVGLSYRKVSYIKSLAERCSTGEFDIDGLRQKPDEELIKSLIELKGIGVWTAEMLMIFCLQRPNILSYGDLAILRGMRMLYRHKDISRERFDKYKKRYAPYGTVASLYLWAIAGGAIPSLSDPAAKN